jgi:hypothetical protein
MKREFIQDFCQIQNLSYESPLLKIIEASVYAISKLAKVRKIIEKDGCRIT